MCCNWVFCNSRIVSTPFWDKSLFVYLQEHSWQGLWMITKHSFRVQNLSHCCQWIFHRHSDFKGGPFNENSLWNFNWMRHWTYDWWKNCHVGWGCRIHRLLLCVISLWRDFILYILPFGLVRLRTFHFAHGLVRCYI